jgi:hypothetical protein
MVHIYILVIISGCPDITFAEKVNLILRLLISWFFNFKKKNNLATQKHDNLKPLIKLNYKNQSECQYNRPNNNLSGIPLT